MKNHLILNKVIYSPTSRSIKSTCTYQPICVCWRFCSKESGLRVEGMHGTLEHVVKVGFALAVEKRFKMSVGGKHH